MSSLHPLTQQLADFYTQSADKRFHTRRRPWPEFAFIAEYINQLDQDHLTILELGCGDGRLYTYLIEHCPSKILQYTWVDVSQWLIDLAQKHYPDATWICEEMNLYLESRPQQSCDIVIGIASIQHLPRREDHSLVFHEIYRVLNYEWSLMMTNRSLSQWFIKRFRIPMIKSIWHSLVTIWYHDWRSMMIPFTDGDETAHRFYHLFRHKRLDQLIRLAWLMIHESCYVDTKGHKTSDWRQSRNHYHVARKLVRVM